MHDLTPDHPKLPALTAHFADYLRQLTPETCTAVVANGGEPLLYLDDIKRVFALVPKNVHRKVMTNGTLLTREIVDWLNKNDIELHISHDGAMTEYLRGVDILKNPRLVPLIKQVRVLRIASVLTKHNPDIMECYEYINGILHREDMMYSAVPMFDNGRGNELIEGFDYDVYARSLAQANRRLYRRTPYYSSKHIPTGNCLLNGDIVNQATLAKYGTIDDERGALSAVRDKTKGYQTCLANAECRIRNVCQTVKSAAGRHICRCAHIQAMVAGRAAN